MHIKIPFNMFFLFAFFIIVINSFDTNLYKIMQWEKKAIYKLVIATSAASLQSLESS